MTSTPGCKALRVNRRTYSRHNDLLHRDVADDRAQGQHIPLRAVRKDSPQHLSTCPSCRPDREQLHSPASSPCKTNFSRRSYPFSKHPQTFCWPQSSCLNFARAFQISARDAASVVEDSASVRGRVQFGVRVRARVSSFARIWRTSIVLGMAAPPRMLRLAATNDSGATSWSPTRLL